MAARPRHVVSAPHQPLIDAYLTDLEHALSDLDQAERRDVVASVREHIDMALSEYDRPLTAHELEALLEQLGSVEQIASAAGAGAGAGAGEDHSSRAAPDGAVPEGWVPLAVAAVAVALFWVPVVAVPLALGAAIAAAFNLRGTRHPARSRYLIAIALSVIPILVGISFGLLLFFFRA